MPTGSNKLDIDPEQVIKLAQIGCPVVDIAWILDCSTDTLNRRFAAELSKGRAQQRTRLRQMMWKSAEHGSVAMQIFLSKQYLGFSDKVENIEGPTAASTASNDDIIRSARIKG